VGRDVSELSKAIDGAQNVETTSASFFVYRVLYEGQPACVLEDNRRQRIDTDRNDADITISTGQHRRRERKEASQKLSNDTNRTEKYQKNSFLKLLFFLYIVNDTKEGD